MAQKAPIPFLYEKSGKLYLEVFVQPKASKSMVVGEHDGRLKVKIKAPPVDGKANKELIRFFSKFLKIPQSQIELVKGSASRKKTLRFSDSTQEQLLTALS